MARTADHYELLYALQDRVLGTVFPEFGEFYLSGGTALGRFILHHRHSDDLDLFTHQVAGFGDRTRLMLGSLRKAAPGANVELSVDAREFKRALIQENGVLLKLDLVADRVPRIG